MKLIVRDDYDALSQTAVGLIADLVAAQPTAAIVLATGETPLGAYRALAERVRREGIDVSRLRLFQLDEYLGLEPGDDRALYGWMERAVLAPLGVPAANVVGLPGDIPDPDEACRAYAAAVRTAGGFDLAVLGLGPNGHLGFNEPPTGPDAPTRPVALTEASIESNGRYWGGRERVPRRALTAGMDLLLGAKRTVLLVAGAHKREILTRTLEGPETPEVPASLLRRAANVTVVADRAAAGGLAATAPAGRGTG